MLENLAGGFPVQRGEGGDVVDGPGGELRQDVVEVFTQIDLEAFAGLHDREDGRDFGPASGLPICNQFLRPTARPRMAFSQRF